MAASDVRPLGPESLVWQLGGDWTVLLGGGRALLLQVAHPAVGAGVEAFSDYRTDPWKRLVGTLDLYLAVVFGGEDSARRAGAHLRALHRDIKGVDYEGNPYHALQPDAFAWVHATLVETAVEMIERYRRPLAPRECDRYYGEMRDVGRLYGLRPRDLPPDWPTFRAYFDDMVHERLADSPTVQAVIQSIVHPVRPAALPVSDGAWRLASWPAAQMARLVTVGTLPPTLRERFALPWTRGQQRALDYSQAVIRRVVAQLPDRLRLLPPAYDGHRRARERRAAVSRARAGAPGRAGPGAPSPS